MYSLVAGETFYINLETKKPKSHISDFIKIFKCDIIENDTIWYRNDIEIKSKKKKKERKSISSK